MADSARKLFDELVSQPLAIHDGPAAIGTAKRELFHWPITTEEDEQAVLQVMRDGNMSGTNITKEFEAEFKEWIGSDYALAACNGTAALLAAMWACEVGAGDEIICPSITYWASALPALQLGATVNFAEIDEDTLCISPDDLEGRIGPRTKAIVVVHYAGHPADMDRIMPIARRHGVRVIEDVSHAQGSLYKGRQCGTIGDIGAMSMMAGKSFAIGEGGMIITDDKQLYERCIAYGHYERTGLPTQWSDAGSPLEDPEVAPFAGTPIGGAKHRLNQTCAAMGRVQLKHYPDRIAEIQRASDRFWDLLADTPGLHRHWPSWENSTSGGLYFARGLYRPEELHGLPQIVFSDAMRAEGFASGPRTTNLPLHLMEVFHSADIFRQGKPTVLAFGQRDVRQGEGTLPVSEGIQNRVVGIPWFKHDWPEEIARHAAAFAKVARHAESLLQTANA